VSKLLWESWNYLGCFRTKPLFPDAWVSLFQGLPFVALTPLVPPTPDLREGLPMANATMKGWWPWWWFKFMIDNVLGWWSIIWHFPTSHTGSSDTSARSLKLWGKYYRNLLKSICILCRKDWLRLVATGFRRSWIFENDDRPKTRLQLWSWSVLRISGFDWSWSSPVSVFFQSWDWTFKHYISLLWQQINSNGGILIPSPLRALVMICLSIIIPSIIMPNDLPVKKKR